MADGKTHEIHGVLAGAATAICLVVAHFAFDADLEPEVAAIPIGVVFGALFLSPDLDLWNTIPNKRWGWFRFVWGPYAWAFSHRGLSHHWVWGPLSRIVYLGIPVCLVWGIGFQFEGSGPWCLWALLGITVGNWVHLLGDL